MTRSWPTQRSRLEAASLRRLLAALTAARDGDVSVRLPGSPDPLLDDVNATFNSLAARLSERAAARERFLPTLAHELRTPLNSMLVLARLLADNPEGNLTAEQVEYARVIHSAGADLLGVISGQLDADGHSAKPHQPAAPDSGQRLLVVESARSGLLTLLARGAVSDLPGADRPSGLPAGTGRYPGGPVEVLPVATADEVADTLAGGPPDCAVLDLGADAELARAVLELVRSRPDSRRVPVLAYGRDELAAAQFAGLRAESAELVRSPGQLRERIIWHLAAAALDTSAADGADGADGADVADVVGADSSARDAARAARNAPEPARRTAGRGTSDRAAAGRAAGRAAGHGPEVLRGKKVLVVDDDPRNVFAITSTLELYGMTVLRSGDGRAGIDQLRSEPDTDLVLMDLMMPGMDGYEAISAIREIPEFCDLPIIAVTAHTMTGELAGGVPGADDCLAKPLDPDELLGRMARCLAS